MLGDWNCDCTSSTLVDSASAGSQADELFFSAPVSLPASGPSTTTTISQNTRTAHLVRRPAGIRMIALALLMPRSPFGLGDLVRQIDVDELSAQASRGGLARLSASQRILAAVILIAAIFPALPPEARQAILEDAGLATAIAAVLALLKR